MPPRSDNPRDRNVPARKPGRESRNASSRPKPFYWLLGIIAIVGVAALAYVATRPKDAVRDVASGPDTTNAGEARGYVLGNPDAPVKIIEYADFECPACAGFATITEPDVRTRIVQTGLASMTFYDFPLTMHPNSMPASLAAACADEQGKFWPMHDRIFQEQDEWNGQATDRPKAFFQRYAREAGVDVARWEACYDSRKYVRRINANLADGLRRGVNSTPSFVIGDKLYAGSLSYDQLKKIVDSAARNAPRPAAASGTPATAR
ncbi:MAG TPA: DsbA family protein [Gemmatimonadaceae bacterium]|nr:DsbA family protein [Gemmatimonadaceae bacterium]